MKRVLLTLAVFGTIFLNGCEKDAALVPVEKTSIKANDVIMCGGCGQWDIVDPDPDAEGSSLRSATSAETDTAAAPAKAPKPGRRK